MQRSFLLAGAALFAAAATIIVAISPALAANPTQFEATLGSPAHAAEFDAAGALGKYGGLP